MDLLGFARLESKGGLGGGDTVLVGVETNELLLLDGLLSLDGLDVVLHEGSLGGARDGSGGFNTF